MVAKCIACNQWEIVEKIDFCRRIPRTGQYLLAVIDTYSIFPDVEIVNSTEAKTCILKVDTVFSRYGIPSKIQTNHGPPLNAKIFERYTKTFGGEWKTITSLWPQSNAVLERFVKPIEKLLKTAEIEGKNWRQKTTAKVSSTILSNPAPVTVTITECVD